MDPVNGQQEAADDEKGGLVTRERHVFKVPAPKSSLLGKVPAGSIAVGLASNATQWMLLSRPATCSLRRCGMMQTTVKCTSALYETLEACCMEQQQPNATCTNCTSIDAQEASM